MLIFVGIERIEDDWWNVEVFGYLFFFEFIDFRFDNIEESGYFVEDKNEDLKFRWCVLYGMVNWFRDWLC